MTSAGRSRKRIGAQFVLLALLCAPLRATPPPASPRQALRVPVWVAGENFSGAPGAAAADFSARVNGTEAPVVAARGPADDLVLLVVTDWTDDLALVDTARDALIAQLEKMTPRTRVALLHSQDGLHVLSDPTSDHAALAGLIRAIPVSGKAGLLDTIETAARVADSILSKAAVRVAVLYITDSNVYNYREDFANPVINTSDPRDMSRRFPEGLIREKINKLQDKLAGFQTPLFIVHLNYRSDRLNEAYQGGIMQLAGSSGGTAVFCRSSGEIAAAVAGTLHTIASHYSLVLRIPGRPSKILNVEVANKGHALTYRNRFEIAK